MAFNNSNAWYDTDVIKEWFLLCLDPHTTIENLKKRLVVEKPELGIDWLAISLVDMIDAYPSVLGNRLAVARILDQYLASHDQESTLLNQILPQTYARIESLVWALYNYIRELQAAVDASSIENIARLLVKMPDYSYRKPKSETDKKGIDWSIDRLTSVYNDVNDFMTRIKPFVVKSDFKLSLPAFPESKYTGTQQTLLDAAKKVLAAKSKEQMGHTGADGAAFKMTFGGEEYVIKQFEKSKSRFAVLREAEFQHRAAEVGISPHVFVTYVPFSLDEPVFIVMEKLERTLVEEVGKHGEIKERYQQEIIEQVHLLDKLHIRHNDLNGYNVMFDKHDHVKLIDFGFAVHLEHPNNLVYLASVWRQVDALQTLKKQPTLLLDAHKKAEEAEKE